jgi:hypothetical protein
MRFAEESYTPIGRGIKQRFQEPYSEASTLLASDSLCGCPLHPDVPGAPLQPPNLAA